MYNAVELEGKAQQGLKQRKTEDLQRAAHTLKSNARNFGGSGLAPLCEELENRAKENNLEGAEELLASIAHEYAKVRAALGTLKKTLI